MLEPRSYRVRIDGAGRVTIPIDARTRYGFTPGTEIVIVHLGGSLVLMHQLPESAKQ